MKRHLSALAVLFYILTVPAAQAGPTASRLPLCEIKGCAKDEETGKWGPGEDCELLCRRSCISSGKPQLSDLFSGDKKGGGCETSANREPLAKEAMPTSSPEITATTEACPEAGCRCEALSPGACQNNRFCYFRNDKLDQSCETLIGYGVEVEDVFDVPLPYPPYITQGGKPLELDIDFSSEKDGAHSTAITLKGSAADKVKEPGGHIEWSVHPGGCFFNSPDRGSNETKWETGNTKSATASEIHCLAGNSREICEANAPYCRWEDMNSTCIVSGEFPRAVIPKRFCGSMSKQDCRYPVNYCRWYDDASEFSFEEERLSLCHVHEDYEGDYCHEAYIEDLVSVSSFAQLSNGMSDVLGLKNASNLGYLELGPAGAGEAGDYDDEPQPEYKPSWIKIKVGSALVTRVEVKVKDSQTKVMCSSGGYYFPATRAACEVYGDHAGGKGEEYQPAIHALLLTDKEYNSFSGWHPGYNQEGKGEFIRKEQPSGPCTSSTVPGRTETRDIVPADSWYANARIKPESLALCRDTPDGCDAIVLDFTKEYVKQTPSIYDNRVGPCEGNFLLKDRNEMEFKKTDNLYLWFPHGYLHLWSINIYHVRKHYLIGTKTYDGIVHSLRGVYNMKDAQRTMERSKAIKAFQERSYLHWSRCQLETRGRKFC